MDQPAEHSETSGIREADTHRDDEPAQLGSAPAPAVEPQGSIFPDPFGEEEAEAVQERPEPPHSITLSDTNDSIVDCMRESEYRADDEPMSGDLNHGTSAFDVNEHAEQVAPVGSAPRTIVPVGNADPTPRPADQSSGEPTCAAHIVGSALQEIVSGLVGSALHAAISAQSVRSADPTGIADAHLAPAVSESATRPVALDPGKAIDSSKKTETAPPDDDHSYQFHAFQEDDHPAPVGLWEEDESVTAMVKIEQGMAVDSAGHEAARGEPGTPVASGRQSHHVVPTGSADAAEGMLDYESTADPENVDEAVPAASSRGGGWTIPVLCAGISIIACCLLIPICDANRRAAYEKLRLRRDLESLQHQVATNDEFLRKVSDDPTLAERLAQRQLRKVRAGMHDVPLRDGPARDPAAFGSMSPFGIVAVPAPPPLAPYQPVGGRIATLCYNPHSRLYLMGAGLMLLAMGLVMGYGPGMGPLGIRRANVRT